MKAGTTAKTIYVDNQLTSTCTTYNPEAGRGAAACGSGSSAAYKKIQDAINGMKGGDDMYIRGGTYYEAVNLRSGGVLSGTASKWTTIQSYAGEWAVINANGGTALGRTSEGRDDGNDINYIKIERLEITGGGASNTGGGIGINGGPIIIRYCYIHDNWASDGAENPAGLRSYGLHDSVIEYNWFKDNGASGGDLDNSANILFFNYYAGGHSRSNYATFIANGHVPNRNIIRYNLLEGSHRGVKYKENNYMTDSSGTDMTYSTYGDWIEHNIIRNVKHTGSDFDPRALIAGEADFLQLYKNILIGDSANPGLCRVATSQHSSSGHPGVFHNTFYNNNIKFCNIQVNRGFDLSGGVTNKNSVQNNIIDQGDSNLRWASGASFYSNDFDANPVTYSAVVDGNLVHSPLDSNHYGWGGTGSAPRYYTTAQFSTNFLTNNYANSNTGLFDNDADYTSNPDFVVQSSPQKTVRIAGTGNSHPYLPGVTLPSYIGATNPNDDGWVNVVSSFSVSYFTNRAGRTNHDEGSGRTSFKYDEGWIEGAASSSDITSPSVPSGLTATAVSSTQINLAWTASTDNVGVSGYRIYRCTGTSCTPSTQVGTSTSTSYSNTGLSASTTYRYSVSAYDAAGNEGAKSSAVSGTTQTVQDTTAPTISSVSTGSITSNSATITWTTNEASDSQIEYGTTTSYGSTTTLNQNLVTSHSQQLIGLLANTLYHYRVKSKDAAGNLATSGDYTFTTLTSDTQVPTTPTNLQANVISSSQINLVWRAPI